MDGKTTTGGRGRAAIIFAALALMIVALGFWSFIHQYDTVLSTRRDELNAVARLKIGEISAWRAERLGDIRISTTSLSRQALLRVLQGDEETTRGIVEYWRELCGVYRYDNVLLFTPEGRLVLSLERAEPHPFVQDLIRRVATEGKALFGDFFVCSMSERIHLDLAAPILDDDGSAAGVLVLRSNPQAYLFPLIQSWPTPSHTAETLLVRKEGGEAVFLNTLRHSQAQPLTLRIPLTDMNIPAVRVISSGRPFSMQGIDYRGVDVLAEVTPIPDTPWFMVAKVDMAEVAAQARSSRVFVSIVTALGIACGALLLLTLVQHRERGTLRSLYESERLLSLTRKQAEESIRASEERWRQTVEVAPFPIMVHAEDGEVLSVNRAWTSLSGYSLADIPAIRDWTQAAYGFEAHDVRSVIDRLYESAEPTREGEFAVRTADGRTRIWDFESAPLNRLEDGRRLVISMAHDITERKNNEEELRNLAENLMRSNRELEQFAYVASHDLQEPLRMVSSYTQLLAARYGDRLDQDAREFIDYAVDGANRMQRLIQDLLAFSRVTTRGGELTVVDTNQILAEALKNLHAAIQETGADVSAKDLPNVMGDSSQLVMLFQNLISNALKFRDPERLTSIRVKAQESPDQDGFLTFMVSDNGIGIEDKFFDRIFVIFQRLHGRREYPGTGIGLALCKRIVERHGGRIWLESTLGTGTTFFFTLPRPATPREIPHEAQDV